MQRVLMSLAVVAAAAALPALHKPYTNYAKPPIDQDDDLGQIIFASVIFRHGDRAPEWPYPNDPYKDDVKYWPRGFGQLTPVGEEQHLRLGTYLRRRYAHMLPLAYNTNNTYVRSTDVDRTLVSARCNLAGLYPDMGSFEMRNAVKFQAIPIHTEAQKNDMLLKTYEICPRHNTLMVQLKKSQQFQCVMEETASVRSKVAKFTGHDQFASDIYDILNVQELHNLPLPKWVAPFYPSPLKDLHLLDNFITISANTELQKLSAGPILKKMTDDMLDKADRRLTPDRSLYVYSAHDNNVVNILQSLQVFNGLLVPYASAVLVELREKNWKHYVTVWYRNSTEPEVDAHLLQLPGCDSLCPLERFVQMIQPVIPDDIEAECAEEVEGLPEQDFQIPPAAIPAEWRHCFNGGKEKNRDLFYDSTLLTEE